jgi:hypothetical protein
MLSRAVLPDSLAVGLAAGFAVGFLAVSNFVFSPRCWLPVERSFFLLFRIGCPFPAATLEMELRFYHLLGENTKSQFRIPCP